MAAALKNVVVTGDTGFVGGHLAARLRRDGVTVAGVSASRGGDVASAELPLAGVDHVFHLAGRTYVPDAWKDPAGFYQINAMGTVRVLEQCRQHDVPLTYVSAYVYGRPERLPINETAPVNPNNPYAFSKYAGEEACRFYAATFATKVSILRLFNVYGPGQRADFLIPTIARQALDREIAQIEVMDLAPRRDYVHVDDVMDALLASPTLPSGEAFNVGSGVSHSVEDVIVACLKAAGTSKPYRARNEPRPNEIADVVADISALRNAAGWQPRVSFADGMASVVAEARNAR